MKVLFVSANNALNASFGAEQRSHVLLRALLANNCKVDYAYIGTTKEIYCPKIENLKIVYWSKEKQWPISKIAKLLRLATFRVFPRSKQLAAIIETLEQDNHYDYIVCRYLQFASLAGLNKYAHKLILDVDDLPAQSFLTNIGKSRFPKSIYHKMMYKSIDNETRRWIRDSYASLFPNEAQSKEYGGTFVPNIPLVFTSEPRFSPDCKNVLFIGRMDFAPNYMGVDAFISNCWDDIVMAVPNSNFLIAGKGLSNELKKSWESHKNVKILGFVDSVLDFYSKGNIIISPITIGAGTNIKVIEALTLGKTCVISKFSTKGFERIISPNVNCIVYENDNDCSSQIIRLLNNDSLAKRIGEESFKVANRFYSQSGINSIIEQLICG